MPRGDKNAYTDKQKRQAEHIEEGYKKQGVSANEAAGRAPALLLTLASVNKETGGDKKSGSGQNKK